MEATRLMEATFSIWLSVENIMFVSLGPKQMHTCIYLI